jgi:toxin ParE1/3/4
VKHVEESKAAARWFNGLEKAVDTLQSHPRRCSAALESKRSGRHLRQLLYGKKPHIYRIIFEIDEPHRVVLVLTIHHGAMERAMPEELR